MRLVDLMTSGLRAWPVSAILLLLASASVVRAQAPAPSAEAGRTIFVACAACHDPAQAQKNGPDLRGVSGRTSGTAPGFRFSRAMKAARLVWDDATLDRFLAEPQVVVPGNTMPYPGLPEAEQRANLIAYLKTLR